MERLARDTGSGGSEDGPLTVHLRGPELAAWSCASLLSFERGIDLQLPRTPKAVVFDMDGLLFDTEALYQKAISAAAAEFGHDLSAATGHMIGRPINQSRRLLSDLYGPTFPLEEFVDTMFRHFDLMAAKDLPLKPGVVELLDTLDELRIPRGIATSSAHHRVKEHLHTHGLGERFEVIVGHGDYSASKPAPEVCLRCRDDDSDGAGPARGDR